MGANLYNIPIDICNILGLNMSVYMEKDHLSITIIRIDYIYYLNEIGSKGVGNDADFALT